MNEAFPGFVTFLLGAALVLALLALLVAVFRRGGRGGDDMLIELGDRWDAAQLTQQRMIERLEREVRADIAESGRLGRDEQSITLKRFGDTLNRQLSQLSESNDRRFAEVRATLEQKLKDIESNNAKKLEEMRQTVDEKLHATLEHRLGESFKLVSDRLELVHRGLGEMQTLAAGVGDLKRVLTNVKTRGTWGEVQLEALLEQVLTPDQYAKNVATVPLRTERVEFAIRLPGRRDSSSGSGEDVPVWLPIDAKFPREDYERLVLAQERADPAAVEEAARALDARIRQEAKTIAEKYVSPPHTTDFGLLYLPTEGLYAEVLRRPGLTDSLQRDFRITIAGPTTLTALLNSLQMGFRTLAIEKRSSEVWQVLGAVKTEFGKFGDVLAKTKAQLLTVTRTIEAAEVRTRTMNRKLRDVEALPGEAAAGLLGDGTNAGEASGEMSAEGMGASGVGATGGGATGGGATGGGATGGGATGGGATGGGATGGGAAGGGAAGIGAAAGGMSAGAVPGAAAGEAEDD